MIVYYFLFLEKSKEKTLKVNNLDIEIIGKY